MHTGRYGWVDGWRYGCTRPKDEVRVGRAVLRCMLGEAMAVILSHSDQAQQEAIADRVQEQDRQSQTDQNSGSGGEWDTVFQSWLGSSVVQGGVEISRMCWLFCQ